MVSPVDMASFMGDRYVLHHGLKIKRDIYRRLYESEDLESAYVLKSPLVVVLSRRLGLYKNGA